MENQVTSNKQSQLSTHCLSNSPEGKIEVRNEIKQIAAMQKMYGKKGVDVAGSILAIENVMGNFSAEKVVWAIRRHAEMSNEFPSPADLKGWIRRNGKPPYERSIYIKIAKKEGCDRTPDEWKYMREYEAEAMNESAPMPEESPQKYNDFMEDRARQYEKTRELKSENLRLQTLLSDANEKLRVRPNLEEAHRIGNTVKAMRENGSEVKDILEFIDSMIDKDEAQGGKLHA